MKRGSSYFTEPEEKKPDLKELKKIFRKKYDEKEILHLHACRGGPILSNELYLIVKEKEARRKLETVLFIVEPYASVSRYLNYWLSGLGEDFCKRLLKNLRISSKRIIKRGILDETILNDLAENRYVRWKNLLDSLFLPIYQKYSPIFNQSGFVLSDLRELYKKYGDSQIRLDIALVQMSSIILNRILQRNGLPLIKPIFLNKELLGGIELKWIGRKNLALKYTHLIENLKKTKEIAINQILKRLKGYKKIDSSAIHTVLLKLKNKPKSPVSLFDITEGLVQKYIKKEPRVSGMINVSIKDQLTMSLNSFKSCLRDKAISPANSLKYIDGNNMIRVCFRLANELGVPLILQSLIRGKSSEVYQKVIGESLKTKMDVSSCCTWDIKRFPEFDKNLIFALKYLKGSDRMIPHPSPNP